MDNSIEIIRRDEIKNTKGKQDYVFSLCVLILATVSLFPVFLFLLGLYESVFFLIFYIGLIILTLDFILLPFEKYRSLLIEILVTTGIIGLILVFTGIGGLAILKKSENGIFLIFWSKGGVQFIITIALFSGIIHLYLKKILLCNYHIRLINSYDKTYFIEYLVKGSNMSKWVNKEKVSRLKLYHSTDEIRLVSLASDKPLEVYPIRKKAYRLPWFTISREYDSFAFVDMEQKTVNIEMTGNVTTKDGVRVEGNVSIQCIIKDDEKCIKRIAINEDEEVRSFKDAVFHIIRDTIAEEQWCDIVPVKGKITEQVKKALLAVLKENDETNEPKYCFQFRSLNWGDIKTQNIKLAETLERTAEEIADADRKIAVAAKQNEVAKIEQERQKKEEIFQSRMKKVQQSMDIWIRKREQILGHEQNLKQIEIWEEIKALLDSEAGKLAVYPEKQFGVMIEELKTKLTDKKEMIRMYELLVNNKQSYTAGQANAFRAAMKQILGERFTLDDERDETNDIGYKELLTGTNEEMKEGEEARHENKPTGSSEDKTKVEDGICGRNDDVEKDSNKTSELNEKESKPEENA